MTVTVPVCAGCRPQAVAGRRWRAVVMLAWLAVVAAFVLPWVKAFGFSRGVTRFLGGIALLVGAAPVLVWWVVRPPAFDLTVGKNSIDYEFASVDYGRRFRARNAGAR